MDVHIGEMRSTVRAVDGESLLTPQVMERLAMAVEQRHEDRRRRDRATDEERRMRTGLAECPWLDEGSASGGMA